MKHGLLRRSIDPARSALQESEARQLSRPTSAFAAGGSAGTRSPFAGRTLDDPVAAQNGRKLPTPVRAAMEARFDRDFSMVRVHDDAAGQRVAQDSAANAMTYGTDIAFGPGAYAPDRPEGQALIAHELVHVAQQQASGIPEVARDGPVGTGLGSAPPKDDFITMDTAGSEDAHALFDLNGANLTTDGVEALAAAIGKPTGPIKVHLHGYASTEGDPTWNRNLSAHRAAAAKKALESRLPEGSRIVLFAHGGTGDFGAEPKENRRVGVSVIGPVEDDGFKLKPSILPPLRFSLDDPAKPRQPLLDPTLPLLPQIGLGLPNIRGPATPDPLGLVVPPLPTRRDLMDLAAIGKGMASHGISPGAYGDVISLWDASFRRYKALGLGDEWAARLANSQVSGTVASQAERDAPNAIDRSNADWKAAHPEERATPIIQSPNLLEIPSWFSKKKKP